MAQLVKMGAMMACSFGEVAGEPDRAASEPDQYGGSAGGEHHGLQADGQHPAVWHVHRADKPCRHQSDGGRAGHAHADALRPGDDALGTGFANRHDRRDAGPEQHQQVPVQLAGVITITMAGTVKTNVA